MKGHYIHHPCQLTCCCQRLTDCCWCSVAKLYLTLSLPGFPVLHYLLELAQIHVRWVSDAIQPSHPLMPSSPPALSLSQQQGLFQWGGSLHLVAQASATVLPVNIQGWFSLALSGLISLLSKGLSRYRDAKAWHLWDHNYVKTKSDWWHCRSGQLWDCQWGGCMAQSSINVHITGQNQSLPAEFFFFFFFKSLFFFPWSMWDLSSPDQLLVPQPKLPALEAQSLNPWTTREDPRAFLIRACPVRVF